MKNPVLTVESILAMGPCERYTLNDAKLLKELFGNRKEARLSEILRREDIPFWDGAWLIEQLGKSDPEFKALHMGVDAFGNASGPWADGELFKHQRHIFFIELAYLLEKSK